MLRDNMLQFTFCMMNIQCLTFRLNFLSREKAALLNSSSFYIHKEAQTCIWFPSSENVYKSKAVQYVINEATAKDIKPSCLSMSHSSIRLASCPLVN